MKALLAAVLVWAGLGVAVAGERGTQDEAMAMVKKAVAYVKANGRDKAIAEFNNPKGAFVDRDLYIFAIDKSGVTVANSQTPRIVGKNTLSLPDQNGKLFIKEFIDTVASKGSGWVEYRFTNPATGKMGDKATYVEGAGDLIVGCGVYK